MILETEYFQLHDPIDGEIVGTVICKYENIDEAYPYLEECFRDFMMEEETYDDYERNIDGFIEWFNDLAHPIDAEIEILIVTKIYPTS